MSLVEGRSKCVVCEQVVGTSFDGQAAICMDCYDLGLATGRSMSRERLRELDIRGVADAARWALRMKGDVK